MRLSNIRLSNGTKVENLVPDSGDTFPEKTQTGEFFFLINHATLPDGLYTNHPSIGWVLVATTENFVSILSSIFPSMFSEQFSLAFPSSFDTRLATNLPAALEQVYPIFELITTTAQNVNRSQLSALQWDSAAILDTSKYTYSTSQKSRILVTSSGWYRLRCTVSYGEDSGQASKEFNNIQMYMRVNGSVQLNRSLVYASIEANRRYARQTLISEVRVYLNANDYVEVLIGGYVSGYKAVMSVPETCSFFGEKIR